MQSNRHFLLTDKEGNNIAVISKKDKASPSEFNNAIALAINEHFIVSKTKVFRAEDELKLTAESTDEDNEIEMRDFDLEEVAVY